MHFPNAQITQIDRLKCVFMNVYEWEDVQAPLRRTETQKWASVPPDLIVGSCCCSWTSWSRRTQWKASYKLLLNFPTRPARALSSLFLKPCRFWRTLGLDGSSLRVEFTYKEARSSGFFCLVWRR